MTKKGCKPVTCVVCGEKFKTYSRGLYCGRSCYNKARRNKWGQYHLPFSQERSCLLCSNIFIAKRSWQLFCSFKCQSKYNSVKQATLGVRFSVFIRDNFTCQYCGRGVGDGIILELDHIIPVSKGGATVFANLITACRECNRGKRDCLLEERSFKRRKDDIDI